MKQYHTRGTRYYQAHLERLKDARALLNAKRWTAAKYIVGIAVECILKFAICQKAGEPYLDDIDEQLVRTAKGHDLDLLRKCAGIAISMDSDVQSKVWFDGIRTWNVGLRYDPALGQKTDAQEFVQGAGNLCNWIWQRSV